MSFPSRMEAVMLKRFALLATLMLGLVTLLGSIGLVLGSGSSAGGTLVSDRSVMTRSDSWYLSSTFSADTATIRTAGRSIVVAPGELRVDGQKVASVDSSAKLVEVLVRGDTISFVADGMTVASSRR